MCVYSLGGLDCDRLSKYTDGVQLALPVQFGGVDLSKFLCSRCPALSS